MGKWRVKQDLNSIESYFILIPNHPRLKTERRVKKDLHSIQSDFNFLREDQATITNMKHKACIDKAISRGKIWLYATAINQYFILKLTLAWCTDVFRLKARY